MSVPCFFQTLPNTLYDALQRIQMPQIKNAVLEGAINVKRTNLVVVRNHVDADTASHICCILDRVDNSIWNKQ